MAIRKALLSILLSAIVFPSPFVFADGYDVLQLPSSPTEMADKAPLFVVRKFGDRYYAAGDRGHIIFSDDGENWTQANVPVRSTLLDVFFVNDQLGWAVGHEGVILHSSDGGQNWDLQYDGLRYGEEGLVYYEQLAAENPENDLYPWMIGEMEFSIEQGADKPFFGVNFYDEKHGHAAGAYGMFVRTEDGGETWEHVLHNLENDDFYHIFDFTPLPEPGKYFLVGEAGLLLVGDINERDADRVHSVPWEGSFFTAIDADDGAVIMGGLRGRMFRTTDAGLTWTVVEKPDTSAIVTLSKLPDGRLAAGGIAGEIMISADDGQSFSMTPASFSVGPVFDFTPSDGDTLIVAGPRGIQSASLAPIQ
ncbi:MAG: YCF48-related protein [Pseudomonadota bacterium]